MSRAFWCDRRLAIDRCFSIYIYIRIVVIVIGDVALPSMVWLTIAHQMSLHVGVLAQISNEISNNHLNTTISGKRFFFVVVEVVVAVVRNYFNRFQ